MSETITLSEPIEFPDMHDGDEIQYTITQKVPRPGFVARLQRFFKIQSGWEYISENGVGTIFTFDDMNTLERKSPQD